MLRRHAVRAQARRARAARSTSTPSTRSCSRPAIGAAELEPLRADQDLVGGMIHKPMFERLILADYAVADLTTANANVFYELGVRHAARPYSTVLVSADVKRGAVRPRPRPGARRTRSTSDGAPGEPRRRSQGPRGRPPRRPRRGHRQPRVPAHRRAARAADRPAEDRRLPRAGRLLGGAQAAPGSRPGRRGAGPARDRARARPARGRRGRGARRPAALLPGRQGLAGDDLPGRGDARAGAPDGARARAVRVRAQPGGAQRGRRAGAARGARGPRAEQRDAGLARPRLQGPLGGRARGVGAARRGPPRPGDRRLPPRLRGRLARRLPRDQRGHPDGDPRPGRRAAAGAAAGGALREPSPPRRARRRLLGSGDAAGARRDRPRPRRGDGRRARRAGSGARALGAREHRLQPVADPRGARCARRDRSSGPTSSRPSCCGRRGRTEGEPDGRGAACRGDHRGRRRRRSPRSARSPRSCAATVPSLRSRRCWSPSPAGRSTTTGSTGTSSRWRGCCATTSSSGTRGGCSAGFAPRERTARSCASRTPSAPTRTWSCPRRAGSTARSRSSPRAARSRTAAAPRRSGSRGRSTSASGSWTPNAPISRAPRGATSAATSSAPIRITPTRGSTRPSSATSWRSSRSGRPGSPSEAAALRERADEIRRRIAATTHGDEGGWGDATLGEALFGLGRFEEAAEHLARVPGGAGRTAVATGDDGDAARRARAAAPLRLGGRRGRARGAGRRPGGRGPPRLHRQGRPGALRRRLPRLAVSHRHPRPAGGVQDAAPRRGALVRLRRLDPRRVLLPQAPPAAGVEGRRRDRGRRLRHPRARARRGVPRRGQGRPPRPAVRERGRQLEDALVALLAHRPRRRPVRAHVLRPDPEAMDRTRSGSGG